MQTVFGLPDLKEKARLVLIPVPWEATTSYGGGTSLGPSAILEASPQIDLFDPELGQIYEKGIHWKEESDTLRKLNLQAKTHAQKVITSFDTDTPIDTLAADQEQVNQISNEVHQWVYEQTQSHLEQNQFVGIVGGDHSSPFGAIRAAAEKHGSFGILHIDAHFDLRKSYQGFEHSHASIMRNCVEKIPQLEKLTQVAIRDFSEEEWNFTHQKSEQISLFIDSDLCERAYQGETWTSTCEQIVDTLPQNVWISFDIDGLQPAFCPHTGTPVPGGLDFQQAVFLLRTLRKSGKKIIGFDLCEVTPSPDTRINEIVGCRILYRLCCELLTTQFH